MKKRTGLAVCLMTLSALTGFGSLAAGSQAGREGDLSAGVNDVPEEKITEDFSDKTIDIDLTKLSGTMVYSEVYHMLASPEAYIGKAVKMNGSFAYYYDETEDIYYFACIIADATACCSQGIEFVLTDEYTYPDDYPEPGEEITVFGTFDTYQEGEYTYCTLRNAKLMEMFPEGESGL